MITMGKMKWLGERRLPCWHKPHTIQRFRVVMQPALLYIFMPLQRCKGKEVQCESVVSGMAACRMQLFSAFHLVSGHGWSPIGNWRSAILVLESRVLAFSHPHSFRSTGYKLSFPLNSLRPRPYVCASTYQLTTCCFCLQPPRKFL